MTRLNVDLQNASVIAETGSLAIGAPSGYVKVFGTEQVAASLPATGAATTLAGSGTVDTSSPWQRITTAGAVTGIILEAGVVHGQKFILTLDKDASGTVTMAAAGTSRVGTGTACVIAVGAGRQFIWDNIDLIWCELGET